MGALARFLANLPEDSEACWPWPGALRYDGRGLVLEKRHPDEIAPVDPEYAYRAVYEALIGPIPAGLVLDHLCRNPACVNPGHLEPVTAGENARRGRARFGHARKLPSGRWQASFVLYGRRTLAPHTFATRADAYAWLTAQDPRGSIQ